MHDDRQANNPGTASACLSTPYERMKQTRIIYEQIFWLEFHYQPGDSDTEPQAVMRIFQINDAERALLALAHLGIVCCQC